MRVNQAVEARLGLDQTYLQDEQAPQNESLSAMWRALEYMPLPHREKSANGWIESRRVYGCKGWRKIPDTFEAHESLQRRKVEVKNAYWKGARDQVTFVA